MGGVAKCLSSRASLCSWLQEEGGDWAWMVLQSDPCKSSKTGKSPHCSGLGLEAWLCFCRIILNQSL